MNCKYPRHYQHLLGLAVLLLAGAGHAQTIAAQTDATTQTEQVETAAAPDTASNDAASSDTALETDKMESVAQAETPPENTVAACSDQQDNDGDGQVDCADSECAVFAICVPESEPSTTVPSTTVMMAPLLQKERGRLCKDGLDNDQNGQVDCFDDNCRPSGYCQKMMYERPQDPQKAMGVFFSTGLGLALPNFKWKEVRTASDYGKRVPFDPDSGSMVSFKLGVAPLRFMAVGLNINAAFTVATNRSDLISLADPDTRYKYDGNKVAGHLGGFLRLQYPGARVVPYLDVAAGYSVARYRWRIYDGNATWSDVDDELSNDIEMVHDNRTVQGGHFTLAMEPGVDVYVVPRFVGVGVRAYVPVYGSSEPGMDNIGLMLNVTFTPAWRSPKQLKNQYRR